MSNNESSKNKGESTPHKFMKEFFDEFLAFEKAFNLGAEIAGAQRATVEYSQIGLRHLSIIHGGALIALPAISKAFDIDHTSWTIIVAAASYAIGLRVCFKNRHSVRAFVT